MGSVDVEVSSFDDVEDSSIDEVGSSVDEVDVISLDTSLEVGSTELVV